MSKFSILSSSASSAHCLAMLYMRNAAICPPTGSSAFAASFLTAFSPSAPHPPNMIAAIARQPKLNVLITTPC